MAACRGHAAQDTIKFSIRFAGAAPGHPGALRLPASLQWQVATSMAELRLAALAALLTQPLPAAASSTTVGLDLSGVWTGSPAGSPKELMLAQAVDGAGPAAFELLCRTTDYTLAAAPCGWASARCNVSGAAVSCDAPVNSGTLRVGAGGARPEIMFGGGPDIKYTGGLSGIWAVANDKDVDAYILAHNASMNTVVAWWDTGVSKRGAWAWGPGIFSPANRSLRFTSGYLSTLQPSVMSADLSKVESGGLSGWAKKMPQIIRPPPPVPPLPPCKDALGCGLNGECVGGICECDKVWRGPVCGELDLQPVDKQQVGLFIPGTTTWGGTPVVTADAATGKKTFHLFAEYMVHNCPLANWANSSQIVHATADSALGPFTVKSMALPPFHHNVGAGLLRPAGGGGGEEQEQKQEQAGSWLIYSTGCEVWAATLPNCSSGRLVPAPDPPTPLPRMPGGCSGMTPVPPWMPYKSLCLDGRIRLARADSPDGPWTSRPLPVLQPQYDGK
eukprot:SAG22_NODE_976_length_6199_cov_1.414426_4_plen_502_part_00